MNILIIFLIKISFCEIIKIPLGIINSKNNTEKDSLISKLTINKPYANLSVGTPPQIIPVLFLKDSFSLFIYEDNFNKNISSTYNSSSKEPIPYFLDFYITGYPSKDIINFGNYKDKNFFDFVFAVFYDNPYGGIGMKIPRINKDEPPSFCSILKDKHIISENIWTVKIDNQLYKNYNFDNNNIIGEIILGAEPHMYEENKALYNEKYYRYEDVPVNNYKFYWDIKVQKIYMTPPGSEEKIEIINNNIFKDQVSLKYESFMINGPQTYHDSIFENFFEKYDYIKNSICEEKKVPGKSFVNYIECINNDKLFDLSKFPTIYFESIELNKIFELNSNDLFILDKNYNKYIFLVLFVTNYKETTWGLGLPFLRKYQFVFNEGKRLIGYYNAPENINEDDINSKNNKLKWYLIIGALCLIIFLLIAFVIFLGYKLGYLKNRKKRANELLDDDYIYNASINNYPDDDNKEKNEKNQ